MNTDLIRLGIFLKETYPDTITKETEIRLARYPIPESFMWLDDPFAVDLETAKVINEAVVTIHLTDGNGIDIRIFHSNHKNILFIWER